MQAATVALSQSIPLRHEVDVFIAGGGPAGAAAAIAASAQGARVFLAEGGSCFGGMGTAGGISMLCSLTDGVNFVAGGVGRRVHDALFALGGNSPISQPEPQTLYFRPEALKLVLDNLLVASGAELSLLTSLVAVEASGGRVSHVICSGKSGLFAVRAKAYVDATGDGDLCAWAGAPYEKGDAAGSMQPGTLVSYWCNIDWERANAAGNGIWKQDGRLAQASADGVFTVNDKGMPGIIPTSPTCGNGNIGHLFGLDGTDERSLTAAALHGRRIVAEYERYFKKYLTGYENMELVTTAAAIGVRETRRITGDYILGRTDYFNRAVFPDEIGRFCYGIDIHASSAEESDAESDDFRASWLKKGESYGIPYRILTPKGLDNVLVAGRCVSTDRAVQGSLRVMPGCFITGQAAGVAAALAARANCSTRALDVAAIQQALHTLGAYLPNFQPAQAVS